MSTSRRRVGAVTATVLLLGVVGAALWMLLGGRWLVVETPSMGTRAPVGSLVQLGPAEVADVVVGDLVTVRPPGSGETWTHEVVAVHADGTLGTAGRLTGPDPWRVDDAMLVGRATAVLPGVGWAVRCAPLLIAVAIAVGLLWRRTPAGWRLPSAQLAAAAGLSAVLLLHQPLQGAEELGVRTEGRQAVGQWVNTGLLPLRVAPVTGDAAPQVVGTGEVARMTLDAPATGGQHAVRMSPDVPVLVWVLAGGAWLVPPVLETVLEYKRRRRPTLSR